MFLVLFFVGHAPSPEHRAFEGCIVRTRIALPFIGRSRWIVVVHLCFDFSLWRQTAPQQSAKFRTAFFGQFRTSLRKDSVANYASIWTLFSTSVTESEAVCNALNVSQIRL